MHTADHAYCRPCRLSAFFQHLTRLFGCTVIAESHQSQTFQLSDGKLHCTIAFCLPLTNLKCLHFVKLVEFLSTPSLTIGSPASIYRPPTDSRGISTGPCPSVLSCYSLGLFLLTLKLLVFFHGSASVANIARRSASSTTTAFQLRTATVLYCLRTTGTSLGHWGHNIPYGYDSHPGGTPRKIGWGGGRCGMFLKTRNLFVNKICEIIYPIYDLTKNSKPCLLLELYNKILFQTCVIFGSLA